MARYSLPLMLPGVLGTVSASFDSVKGTCAYVIALTIGELELDLLSVHGAKAVGHVHLIAGGVPVSFSAQGAC